MDFSKQALENLLKNDYQKAITQHRNRLVAFYSFLFDEPNPCVSCESKLQKYWQKLQEQGVSILTQKEEKMKKQTKKTDLENILVTSEVIENQEVTETIENQEVTKKFKLKEGIVALQLDFGSAVWFNNDTLTDELALEYLKINPNRIVNFSVFPENWKELISTDNSI